MSHSCDHLPYVLITPARNEAAFIEKTIQSVVSQTALPVKWIIVNDGSTDATGQIVRKYIAAYDWIEIVDMPERRDRNFAAKVHSFNAGYAKVKELSYEVIGNLDADVSFEQDFIAFLLSKFAEFPQLGVAGTIFEEEGGYSSGADSFEGQNHVSGQVQFFRRACFQDIGGYIPHKAGGIDWMAVTTARMLGWQTRSFREKAFFHHRHLGTAERSALASAFSYGEKDYYLGGHPVWELFRVAYRMIKKPYLVEGMALGLGYLWALVRQTEKPVSKELMQFHRKEQMWKLKIILKALLKLKRIDNFQLMPSASNFESGPMQ